MLASDKAIQKALAKRKKAQKQEELSATPFRLEDHLFDQQLNFVKDPSLNKIAVCSRRAGKTVACAADLVFTAINNPNTVSLYITLSRSNAKKIIWKEVKELNKRYNLGGVQNLVELSFTFPNGATIYLSGAKDASEIEKFRGLALKLVYIDEAQAFRDYIKELIDDVLAPALMDYSGTLNLIGTPGPVPTGFFHDCFVNDQSKWSKHSWTFFDNPFITQTSKKTHQQMLELQLLRRGVPLSDPSIQREFFGKFIKDTNSLLIRYDELTNHYDSIPKGDYNYIMGIDLGFDDADAIAVLAWSESHNTTYLVEELVVNQQGITELVKQIESVRNRYTISKMVIDQGGLGKKIAEEMRRRYSIPVEAADKARKMENIAIMNDSLRTGRLKAKKHSKFAMDSYLVQIDQDKSTSDRIVVSKTYHSDIIDSVLYAFRESPAFAYQEAAAKPKWGTKEWAAQEQDRMLEEAIEKMKKEAEMFNNINNLGFPD